MDSRHSLLTLFLSSVAFSGCVTNIKTLELSETVSPQDSALLLTARLDKSSTVGSYCELRFTNEKSDEFSLNIDRSSEFHLVKLQPGQY